MSLNRERLKQKIKQAFKAEQTEEESYDDALDRICEKIASAVVDEMLQLRVEVPAGIQVATTGTVAAQKGVTTEPKIAELS